MVRSREIVAKLPNARIGIAPHSLRAVSPEQLREVTAIFTEGPVHIHAAEQTKEVDDCVTSLGTRPVQWLLDELGLEAAVEWYVDEFRKRTGLSCRLRSSLDDRDLDPAAATALFRILQEALTNVARHARARRVRARLESSEGRVLLAVEDDGVGLGGPLIPNLGLLGMSERVSALGGTLRVTSAGGAGVRVEACIPVESKAERTT